MRSSALVFLLCSSWALARDPFQPLAASQCQAPAAVPQGWRLQGIVGRAPHFIAWLVSPQGQSQRLSAPGAFPVAPWQITQLNARSLVLSATQSCPPQQITWVIKGGFYEKDAAAVAGAEQSAARH
ncbi:HofP DNA utilization family protein [Pantoea dispersa]|uniref:HofP DNA utilization family protein n=1 Tax=Pantoea dispersa TaxID=59814 RepID=UPI002DB76D27|nr:HofP DNA utilization family protein [Pantoea dispersa]MEB5974063.1 DUF2531 family protein [Pantoea dispersa]